MTEKLHRLTMRSFRGVPGEMEVDFGSGQSIAVYGDNGTGKSTIADALEWFFTGEIELLSHEGRQHAIRNLSGPKDGETSVEIMTSGSLGGRAVFPGERSPESLDIGRETFLLRGRTLADFINKSKSEKWKALAEILGLDAIELLRQDLQRARNDIKKQVKAAEERIEAAKAAFGGSGITEEAVLQSLQQICRGLGVEVPETLDVAADSAWIASVAGAAGESRAPTVEALASSLSALRPVAADREAIRAWTEASRSSEGESLSRLALFRDADALLSSSASPSSCPLCGQSVSGEDFTARVRDTLSDLLDSTKRTERLRDSVDACRDSLARAVEARGAIRSQARALRIDLAEPAAVPLDLALESVERFEQEIAAWDEEARSIVARSAPSPSTARPAQLAQLAQLCEAIRAWRSSDRDLARTKKALALAERVYDAYQDRQKEQLEEMLGSISRRVAEIYDELHPGERLGGITVEPWTAKGLELAVDFHGTKQRPPHGVLSESHLNSLAIALFLAMAQTFNRKLRFLVLDDVINSFDLEHRGQLATLLAEKFDDWQLIVLTHDRQFFEHLSRRAPSWKRLEITSWTYDQGPRVNAYRTSGILGEARERIAQGDVNGAATKSRRALEELLQETCEALRAALPFRRGTSNDRREIGELMRGLRRAVKDHAKGMLPELEPLLKNVEADVGATLNVEAHASRGRSASAEVEAALARIEELDRIWSCPDCGTRLWHKGTPEASRCRCGKSVFPPPS